ncbi:MAG: C39 family peptidase [Acidocella sp.]|uniref:C39 family peptidase n=1 Tax=Acidocella sp. TaxID=50710 RepID=UPI003FD7825E
MRIKIQFATGLLACTLLGTTSSHAGQISFNGLTVGDGGGYANVSVQSFEARKFSTTIKQQYDFSCGSAALATLLLFTYHQPATESSVFIEMFQNGDQKAIVQSGFSLLDMKEYLSRHGIPSGGFRAPLEKIAEIRIPAIVLMDEHGYKHFVVLRGIQNGNVLLSDPAIGLRTVSIAEFEKQWSGIFFIVLSDLPAARANFNDHQDWSGEPGAPVDLSRFMVNLATLQQVTMPNPSRF